MRGCSRTATSSASVTDATILDHLKAQLGQPRAIEQRGDLASGAALASRTVEDTYFTPYIAHAAIETHSAVAQVTADDATVWVSTQRPFGVQGEVARLAKLAGAPVQVVWTRDEEFFLDTFRPAAYVAIRSGLDAAGKIVLWDYHVRFAGDIRERSFSQYEITRFSQVPTIELVLVENPELAPQGCGEPTITAMAAVIANALYDATGARLTRLPLTAERVKSALG